MPMNYFPTTRKKRGLRLGLETRVFWRVSRFLIQAARDWGWGDYALHDGVKRGEVVFSISSIRWNRKIQQYVTIWTTSPVFHRVAVHFPIYPMRWPPGNFIVTADAISRPPEGKQVESFGIYLIDKKVVNVGYRGEYPVRIGDPSLYVPRPNLTGVQVVMPRASDLSTLAFLVSGIPDSKNYITELRNVHLFLDHGALVMEASDGLGAARFATKYSMASSFDTTAPAKAIFHAARALRTSQQEALIGYDASGAPCIFVEDGSLEGFYYSVSWIDQGDYLDPTDTFETPDIVAVVNTNDLAAWSIAVTSKAKTSVVAVLNSDDKQIKAGILRGRKTALVREFQSDAYFDPPNAPIAVDAEHLKKVLVALSDAGSKQAILSWNNNSHLHIASSIGCATSRPPHYVLKRLLLPRGFRFAGLPQSK